MIRSAKLSLAFGLVGLLALASSFPVTVVDDRGLEIVIPARPERIVAIGALYIEVLLDIGAGARLVCVADSPDNPAEVASLARVGPAFSPSVEAILACEPDLVLGAWGAVRERLEELKVTVLTTGLIAGLPDIFGTVRTAGKAVGNLEEAEALIGRIAEEVVLIEGRVLGRWPVRAAFLYMAEPDTPPYVAGSGSIENELLLRAGGANVFGDIGGFPQVSLEELLARDPEVIFTDPAQVENIYRSRLLSGLAAVRERRVHGIKASEVTSTRVARALRAIAQFLHPEAFGEGE
ncbi:MAG: ABC transporter substrate-binding protein [Candidatus Acetothermia bacterium]|nr:ABC transporter substrate-binding protein [Candidatus Acetothermia bacterium]MDH7504590.1 ABC transporter substrate-binding protein [Candidatus Acetothermia bacterium]